jgi:glutathione S-transferase
MSDSGKAEFVYFDSEGRCAGVRIALTMAGIPFNDNRITYQDFLAGKEKGLYQTGLPYIKLSNGKTYTQSHAILRWACKKAGLYPSDPDLALAADEIQGVCFDMLNKCPHDKDPEKKKTAREEYAAGRLKSLFQVLEARHKENGGPFMLGTKMTMADFNVIMITRMIMSGDFDFISKDYVDQFPAMKAVTSLVESQDAVKSWFAARDAAKAAK